LEVLFNAELLRVYFVAVVEVIGKSEPSKHITHVIVLSFHSFTSLLLHSHGVSLLLLLLL